LGFKRYLLKRAFALAPYLFMPGVAGARIAAVLLQETAFHAAQKECKNGKEKQVTFKHGAQI